MEDRKLYAKILGVRAPWGVQDVVLNHKDGDLTVKIVRQSGNCRCPVCGAQASGYDHRIRRWRHLDTCQYRTIIEARVPRVKCPEHGVHQIKVPWSEENSRFTELFEALIVSWLQDASIEAVARHFGLSWDAVDGIMQRAVARGLARKETRELKRIGVDETSYRKGHNYLTVVTDLEKGTVEYVAEDRTTDTLSAFYKSLPEQMRENIETVAMDMWPAFMKATMRHVPGAEEKICYDKFHVAQHLGNSVDKVRRQEHKALRKEGRDELTGTKYWWLHNPANIRDAKWYGQFNELRKANLKTARAWAIRQEAMGLWHYRSRAWAYKAWRKWYGWAIRSRLEPVKKTARMIKKHLDGIVNAVVHQVSNAGAESMNSRIQGLKKRARGYRNTERLKTVIYFHFGGLDLSPATHTISG